MSIQQEQQSPKQPPKHTIKVLLVDDHPLVLDGIQARIEGVPGIEVIGQAHNGLEALEHAKHSSPNVVLMDVSMPVMNGMEATRRFQTDFPAIKVLILTMHDNKEYILQLMQSGASGYILKDVSSDELIKAIETVYQGNTYFSQSASQTLFNNSEAAQPQTQNLTKREETVLKLLAEGNSNKGIANELKISVRTVETHRQNIKGKLDIHTAAGLAKYAIEHNLVQLS
ncbi:response regulator transcription factor [Motiliproteus sp. MSK22-1]|uniref:response regulator transcription factor n=1 Tax=Motiliproteus sp. MSK22-1 TaxID=1897630 RepID=UPI00097610B0|nr:response regulator transcription factor [Motiliproteus sp. MSK22-1]OMH30533.1 DNA-binding response regulator [Motiliproteus sp. MSK22-1]